ncbi:MAG TPA: nucleoside hydrolase [Pseudonocardia sp.]|nr:nucleoside hydrolase [Pseudonocardia sp.]
MYRVILDTDLAMGAPGSDIDDGFALALALADPDVSLELVTTVNGNTDVESATTLTVELLERLGRRDVRVVRGAADPLMRPRLARTSGSPAVPAPADGSRDPAPGRAATEIVERILAAPGEITLVAIGPLTNVATALLLAPELATAVREIVIMGGVFLGHTNRTGMPGEFNIWVDPDAAAVVLASGAPLRFVGLDVTRQVRLTREHAGRMAAEGRPFGTFAGKATEAWIDFLEDRNPGDESEHGSCALHDPLAMAVVTQPDLVTWREAHVDVETAGDITRGITVADLLTTADPPAANCRIATAVDVAAFTDLFLDRVRAL